MMAFAVAAAFVAASDIAAAEERQRSVEDHTPDLRIDIQGVVLVACQRPHVKAS